MLLNRLLLTLGLSLAISGCSQTKHPADATDDTKSEQASLPAGASLLKELGVSDRRWTDKYDRYFSKYSKRFFGPGLDWRWFKAQGIAESGLKHSAISRVGAKGIMQIMPATYKEITGRLRQSWIQSIDDPKWNIPAGIFYDHYLYELWDEVEGSAIDRLAFTFSSYNCGYSRTRQARRSCGETICTEWLKVQEHVPGETRAYVIKVMALMGVEL